MKVRFRFRRAPSPYLGGLARLSAASLALALSAATFGGARADEPAKEPAAGAKVDALIAEAPTIPPRVVYKKASDDENRKAIDKLSRAMVAGGAQIASDDLFAKVLICGPGLWANLKDEPVMKAITGGVAQVQIPSKNGPQVLDAKLFQTKDEVAAFWKCFGEKIKLEEAHVRRPTAAELTLYWAMISFDITEPIFVVESKTATVLAHFGGKDAKILWIDDFKNLHLKGES